MSRSLALAAIAVAGLTGMSVLSAAPSFSKEDSMFFATKKLPPIDVAAPRKVVTATFALG